MNRLHQKILEMHIRQSNIKWLRNQIILGFIGVLIVAFLLSYDQPAQDASSHTSNTFNVEHDEAYLATRQYIWDFLSSKGFEIQVNDGVPSIERIEAASSENRYVGWYAYARRNGEWQKWIVLLYDGEVVSAVPIERSKQSD